MVSTISNSIVRETTVVEIMTHHDTSEILTVYLTDWIILSIIVFCTISFFDVYIQGETFSAHVNNIIGKSLFIGFVQTICHFTIWKLNSMNIINFH